MAAGTNGNAGNPTFKAVGISLAVGSGYILHGSLRSLTCDSLFIGTSFVLYACLFLALTYSIRKKRGLLQANARYQTNPGEGPLLFSVALTMCRITVSQKLDMVGRNEYSDNRSTANRSTNDYWGGGQLCSICIHRRYSSNTIRCSDRRRSVLPSLLAGLILVPLDLVYS